MTFGIEHNARRQLAMVEDNEFSRLWIEECIAEFRRERRLDLRIDDGADIFLIPCGEILFAIRIIFEAATILARIGAEFRLVSADKGRECSPRLLLVSRAVARWCAELLPQPRIDGVEIDLKSGANIATKRPAFGIIIDAAVIAPTRVERDRRAVVRPCSDL